MQFLLKHNLTTPTEAGFPYTKRDSLLTDSEREFYRVLAAAVGDRFLITFKVRLADIVKCPHYQWLKHGRTLAQKHVDFVLCDPKTISVVACIELDDRSHGRAQMKKRDAFVDEALKTAGVVLIRFSASKPYSPADLVHVIDACISKD